MKNPAAESATSRLREEHQLILQVSDAMQALIADAEQGKWYFDAFADCITFIRLFADACHHGKEEDLLFPELEKAGMGRQQGPIAVMLEEHRIGREYVRFMAEALEPARGGDEEARARLKNAAQGYVQLIRAHIMKEDHVLFNMADHVVRGSACQSLCLAYGAVCARRFEGHSKDELAALAESITEQAGLDGLT
jgi:hemerythrin-like domain-containing protein